MNNVGSIGLLLLMFKTLLYSVCLVAVLTDLTEINQKSRLLTRFQLFLSVIFWLQNKKMLNFWKHAASSNFGCYHSIFSFLHHPSNWWQLITSYLASPLVYFMSLISCLWGKSILISTTSRQIAMKYWSHREFLLKDVNVCFCCQFVFHQISFVTTSCFGHHVILPSVPLFCDILYFGYCQPIVEVILIHTVCYASLVNRSVKMLMISHYI